MITPFSAKIEDIERRYKMLKKKLENALNKQINAELYSAYLYLAMAAYFQSLNLKGFASWMEVQVQEELTHVKKFYDFVYDRGGKVKLASIEAPPATWKSPLEAFQETYKHETWVSSQINKLAELADAENDRSLLSFLQWFIDEQVEEEATADDIVQQIKLAGEKGPGLFMMDRELGQRVFTPPTDQQA